MKTVVSIGIIVLLMMGALGATGAYIHSLQSDLIQANKKIRDFEKAQSLAWKAEAKARAIREEENEKAKQRERLMENVLCHNNDWSGIVVPDDVARMLQQNGISYNFDNCIPASGDTSR